jgi:adenylylsulfate kinase
LPASGKTTLAYALQARLSGEGIAVQVLDSDELRQRLTPKSTYSLEERAWFYEMIVFLAELLTGNGVNVLIAATADRRSYRDLARRRLARFAEIYVACPAEVCRRRDPKGLWRRALAGEISNLPGVGTVYEPPAEPAALVNTATLSLAEAIEQVWQQLRAQQFFA